MLEFIALFIFFYWLIPSESIPSPKARDGVLSMEWRASIGENLKADVSLYEVFLG